MNHYRTSSGERLAKSVIDRRITEAKKQKIEQMIDEHGYIFCEECGKNSSCGMPLDCSHEISVDECQKTGRAELAYDVKNIKIRCRSCHQKHDHTHLETIKTKNNEKSRKPLCTGTHRIPIAGKFRIT